MKRERDGKDERKVIVSLTSEGHTFHEKLADAQHRLWDSIGYSREEVSRLNNNLVELRKNLMNHT